MIMYNAVFSLLDKVTSAVPVTFVRKGEEAYVDPVNGNDTFVKKARECMEGCVGLPVGIQVTTLPFQEEENIGIMKLLEELLGYDVSALGKGLVEKLKASD